MSMLATGNFMYQRLTINFGLVCMIKIPLGSSNGNDSGSLSGLPTTILTITGNDTISATATRFDEVKKNMLHKLCMQIV
jgi:hypothetical protein